jgi:uncharacterized protein
MFTKSIPFEIKANIDKYEFEGYASTYKKDLVGDQVVQGAFKKTIAERLQNGKIKVLWQHSEPFGMPMEMHEDSKGLYVKAKVTPTSTAKDRLMYMESGVVDEMSIGYDVLQDEISEDGGTRLLKELKLYEVSPVTFGANPYTSINSVKSLSILNELQPHRLATLFKEGRAISARNLERLQQARASLDEILALIESTEDGEKSRRSQLLHKQPAGITQEIKDLEAAFNLFKDITKGR